MYITAKRTEDIEVELTQAQVNDIMISEINKVLGYPTGWFIENGFICVEEEYYTSHSWSETKQIRPSNAVDYIIYDLQKRIQERK